MLRIKRTLPPVLGSIALAAILLAADGLSVYWVHLRNLPPPVRTGVDVPPSVQTFALVRHTWRAAVMVRRVHRGMTLAQARRILGHPYQHEDPLGARMTDVSMLIQFRETYFGQDGPLYVCYRDSSVPPYIVVADASTERKDLGPDFL